MAALASNSHAEGNDSLQDKLLDVVVRLKNFVCSGSSKAVDAW